MLGSSHSPRFSDSSKMSEESLPRQPESEDCPAEDLFAFGHDLELNQFDGLPFSSRYYKLLRERKTLPVWGVRGEFEDALSNNPMVIVSGTAKTGRSTQVGTTWAGDLLRGSDHG